MALNKQVFRTRALTALFFVIIMLAGLLWNSWSFLLLFTIIHFGCWHEYLSLVEKINGASFNKYSRLGWMLSGYAVMLLFSGSRYAISGYGLKENGCLPLSLAGFILIVMGIFSKSRQSSAMKPSSFGAAFLGWFYISMSWGMMLGLQGNQELQDASMGGTFHDFTIPVVLIASIWINDTMAYIVGSFIGKTPFSSISPKKTWEGTIGGALLCVAVMSTVAHYLFLLKWLPAIVIPFIAATAGTSGDLLESKLKRMANVKDSGNMMPGHGGFMDRFDSLLLATPVVYAFVMLFIRNI